MKTEKRRRVLRAVAFLYGVVGALLMVAPTYGLLQLLHVKAMSGKYDRVPREWLVDAVDLNVRFVHIVLGIGFLMLVFAYSVWSFLKPAKDQAEIANQPSQPIAGKPGSG